MNYAVHRPCKALFFLLLFFNFFFLINSLLLPFFLSLFTILIILKEKKKRKKFFPLFFYWLACKHHYQEFCWVILFLIFYICGWSRLDKCGSHWGPKYFILRVWFWYILPILVLSSQLILSFLFLNNILLKNWLTKRAQAALPPPPPPPYPYPYHTWRDRANFLYFK